MWKRALLLLVLCVFVAPVTIARAQETASWDLGAFHLDTAVQALRTEAQKEAVGFVFNLFKNQQEVFYSDITQCRRSNSCNLGRTHGWLFDLAPDIRINTGTEDAFQSIVGKISGNFIMFSLRPPRPGGSPLPTPDPHKLIHVFPLSAGIETTANGDTLNAVGEFGYVPFKFSGGPRFGGNDLRLGINPHVGFFVQGGQKLRQEAVLETGGARDESSEAEGKGIARLKSVASMQLLFPMRLLGLNRGISVEPSAIGWYDLVNEEVYYSLKLSMGIALLGSGGERSTLWEFTIQDGSGEPNFTEGTQFGTGLKLVY